MGRKSPKVTKKPKQRTKFVRVMPQLNLSLGTSKFCIVPSLIALVVSVYSVYVHQQIEKATEDDEEYEPICDINQYFKCSEALSSPYAKGFGLDFLPQELRIPNGIYGVVFYSIMVLLSLSKNVKLATVRLVLAVISVFISIYLAYIMVTKLNGTCPVCLIIYAISFYVVAAIYFERKRMIQLTPLIEKLEDIASKQKDE